MKRKVSQSAIESWRIALAQNEAVITGNLRNTGHYKEADEIAKAFRRLDQELKFTADLERAERHV